MRRRGRDIRSARVPRPPARRGITFLETIAATLIVGMVAASLASSVGFMSGAHRRNLDRLACSELANRLMLQYIDDPNSLPSSGLEVEYAGRRYRWSMSVTPTKLDPFDPQQTRRRNSAVPIDRVQLITVSVWLSDSEVGGTYALRPESISTTLTRLYDPQAFARNTDSFERLANDPEELVRRVMEGGAGGAFGSNAEGGAGRGGARPAPGGSGR